MPPEHWNLTAAEETGQRRATIGNHFCPEDGCQLEGTEGGYVCAVCGYHKETT